VTRRVCVIGAGVVGLHSALALARRGVAVTVLEAAHVAAGSSGRSVGVVATQQIDPLEIELRAWSMRFLETLEPHGLVVHRIGYARLGHTAAVMEVFSDSVVMQHELGIRDARVLDHDQLRQLVPEMDCDDLEGALFGPTNGFVDGHLYCGLLAELVAAHGGRVVQHQAVTGVARADDGTYLLRTADQTHTADVVVNAAGPWAARVAALFGCDLPIVAERHEAAVVMLDEPLGYRMPMVMDYVAGFGGSGLNFRHERDRQLITEVHAATGQPVADPDAYAETVDQEDLVRLAELFSSRLPGLRDARLGQTWAGLYPVSPSGRAIVGPLTADGSLIAAAGAGGYGIQLSPVMGALAADWVVDGSPTTIPAARVLAPVIT
jgi:sarcosine oxidase, subunit beta